MRQARTKMEISVTLLALRNAHALLMFWKVALLLYSQVARAANTMAASLCFICEMWQKHVIWKGGSSAKGPVDTEEKGHGG